MKINKLIAICKKSKRINLCDGMNHQWCGDGACLYQLVNMPELDKESIYTIFDISVEQQKSISYNRSELPIKKLFEDTYEGEQVLDRESISINMRKDNYIPLITSRGVIFINGIYLTPITDNDYIELYERVLPNGRVYIAAKQGLLLIGIISPCNLIDETFLENMEELTEQCRYSFLLNNNKSKDENLEDADYTDYEEEV